MHVAPHGDGWAVRREGNPACVIAVPARRPRRSASAEPAEGYTMNGEAFGCGSRTLSAWRTGWGVLLVRRLL